MESPNRRHVRRSRSGEVVGNARVIQGTRCPPEIMRNAPLAYLDSKVAFFRRCESSLPGQLGSGERSLPDKLDKAELLVML